MAIVTDQLVNKLRILYLYTDLMGYQIPIFNEYVEKYNAEVHVIHWDHKKKTPYKPHELKGIYYYKRSNFNKQRLITFVSKIKPDIVYVSGWVDKGYLATIRNLRKQRIPVVCGFDDIWKKTLKQKLGSLLFPLIKSSFFSHAWVAGPYQYEFAKRLGFSNNEIIFNCLSADNVIFNTAYFKYKKSKAITYPHNFLYAGRFDVVKGLDILLMAWNNIKDKRKDWKLTLIGNGPLKLDISKISDVNVIDFLQPEELTKKIGGFGCFILPSRKDQWALVIHEFSSAGLPIVCSNVVGAAPVFIIPKFNGLLFKSENILDLENKLLYIINSKDSELLIMSENSHLLGQKITPSISAACFLSIII